MESLGHFAFGPIANPRKNYPVEIQLNYDTEGLLKIKAVDLDSGKEMSQVMSDDKNQELADLTYDKQLVESVKIN